MSRNQRRNRTRGRRKVARASQRKLPVSGPWIAAIVLVAIAAVAAGLTLRGGGDDGKDSAGTWQPGSGNGELSVLKTPDYHSMAISPADPNLVLYGHHGGVLLSRDGGRSWEATNLEGETDDAMGMGFADARGEVVLAAGHDTFFRSTDGGRTWERVQPDLPRTDVHGLAATPGEPGRILAFVVGSGLYRSDDGGDSWTRAATDLPVDILNVSAGPDDVVYAVSMGAGILKSTDGGMTFAPLDPLPSLVASVATSASDGDVVYAGGAGALYRSTDGGSSWERRAIPGGGQVMIVTVNPADPMDVMLLVIRGDDAGYVFRSEDGGQTWLTE